MLCWTCDIHAWKVILLSCGLVRSLENRTLPDCLQKKTPAACIQLGKHYKQLSLYHYKSDPSSFPPKMITNCIYTITWIKDAVRVGPCSGELQTQKLKSHLERTRSLNILPLKPVVGQYIAIHAMLTARDFLLAYFCPSGPFTCIFSKTSPDFFLCRLWLTPVPLEAHLMK